MPNSHRLIRRHNCFVASRWVGWCEQEIIVLSRMTVYCAVLSRSFIARESCSVYKFHTATLLHEYTKQTWILMILMTIFLQVD